MDQYRVLGVMSGSSLDGLDLCYCVFSRSNESWTYKILGTETIEIPNRLTEKLRKADQLDGLELNYLNLEYGNWVGINIKKWLDEHSFSPSLIGFHGHTVFHAPEKNLSLQIGDGLSIAHNTGIPVVDAFRSLDILKGGQGAPLVPVGEHYLFPDYKAFINLGGIANISIHEKDLVAWDIAPCNQVLNYFSSKQGMPFDLDGRLAEKGTLIEEWYQEIKRIPYFHKPPPKSLSNQWTEKITGSRSPEPQDALATYTRFLANMIADELNHYLNEGDKIMITGGGAFNHHLIREIKYLASKRFSITIPSSELVSFKEALIFGFLGLLRQMDEVNIFKSVTGASDDSCAGTIHHPD